MIWRVRLLGSFLPHNQPHPYSYCNTPVVCSAVCELHCSLMFVLLLVRGEHPRKVCVLCTGMWGCLERRMRICVFLGVSSGENHCACYLTRTKTLQAYSIGNSSSGFWGVHQCYDIRRSIAQIVVSLLRRNLCFCLLRCCTSGCCVFAPAYH